MDKGYNCSNDTLESFTLLLWDIIEEGGTGGGQINIHIMATGAQTWKCKSSAKTTKQPYYESCCTKTTVEKEGETLYIDSEQVTTTERRLSPTPKAKSPIQVKDCLYKTQHQLNDSMRYTLPGTSYNVHVER